MPLLPVSDALNQILEGVRPLSSELVELERSLDRVLATDIRAGRNQPPFDASAMDGYAVRYSDLATLPATLKVVGTSSAGRGYRGSVGKCCAVRVFTGAPVPRGADAVIIQENVKFDGEAISPLVTTQPGQNIRRKGLDFRRGDIVLKGGTKLGARHLALAAAVNQSRLRVRRKPRVAIISTGDELVLPGGRPGRDQIVASNGISLRAFVTRFGGECIDMGIVGDSLRATKRAIARCRAADVLVTTGGASVGDHDFVRAALIESGISIKFWKIAMRPGKPLMFGRRGAQRVLGLPGNPVSAMVCARLFLKPLLDALLAYCPSSGIIKARLAVDMRANDGREDYIRARLTCDETGTQFVTPFPVQDSSMQSTFADADALLVRRANAPPAKAGEIADVLPLDF